MNKTFFIAVLFMVIIITIPAFAVTQVYDSGRDVIYIGGYVFTHAQEVVKEKPEQRFNKRIYEINSNKYEAKVFIETKDDIGFFEISNAGYMAVSTRKRVYFKDKGGSELKTALHLYDGKGVLIKTFDNVPVLTTEKYFSWAPDGTKIVFVNGKQIPDYWAPFEPMGVWLYDIEKDELKKISDDGWDVRWARYDDNIHILKHAAGPTYVYDITSGKLTENKDGKGIIFSPDGMQYIGITLGPGDGSKKKRYHLYSNNLKKSVFTFEDGFWKYARFVDNGNLLVWHSGWGFYIFDVNEKKDFRLGGRNRLLGWNKDMTKVVVYEGGDKIHIDELLTGKRLKSLEIPK